eukprot:s102_g10.t1
MFCRSPDLSAAALRTFRFLPGPNEPTESPFLPRLHPGSHWDARRSRFLGRKMLTRANLQRTSPDTISAHSAAIATALDTSFVDIRMQNPQQMHDTAPKVNAFRSYCIQLVDQLCVEFEREVNQMSKDILLYRGELARCADLLAFQLGKEKEYHNMLENIAGNSSMLVGKAAEVGQKHGQHDATKQQMHQMLEDMFAGGKGALADSFGGLDEHRQLAEKHLMSSAELQNQSQAVAKELDNIMRTLNEAPVSYREAPVMMVFKFDDLIFAFKEEINDLRRCKGRRGRTLGTGHRPCTTVRTKGRSALICPARCRPDPRPRDTRHQVLEAVLAAPWPCLPVLLLAVLAVTVDVAWEGRDNKFEATWGQSKLRRPKGRLPHEMGVRQRWGKVAI